MAFVNYTLSEDAKPTEEQITEIENAAKRPAVFDEDCPPLTSAQLDELSDAARKIREDPKRTISINLSERAIIYFKNLAQETGVAYQTLINMYLVQCANEKKRPVFA